MTQMVDPARQYPSPYVAFGNNPISKVDPDGGCDTGDCPGDDILSRSFSEGFSRYSYEKHSAEREARLQPGVLESMWNATTDFGGDLVSGRLFSNAWKGISDYVTDYPNSMLKNLEYQYKLGQGEIPANQVAYDLTYGAWSFVTVRGASSAIGSSLSLSGFRTINNGFILTRNNSLLFRLQFAREYINPIKGRGATGSIKASHMNIQIGDFKTHTFFNPMKWQYLSTNPYTPFRWSNQ